MCTVLFSLFFIFSFLFYIFLWFNQIWNLFLLSAIASLWVTRVNQLDYRVEFINIPRIKCRFRKTIISLAFQADCGKTKCWRYWADHTSQLHVYPVAVFNFLLYNIDTTLNCNWLTEKISDNKHFGLRFNIENIATRNWKDIAKTSYIMLEIEN